MMSKGVQTWSQLGEHHNGSNHARLHEVAANDVAACQYSDVLGVRVLCRFRLTKPNGVIQDGTTVRGQNEVKGGHDVLARLDNRLELLRLRWLRGKLTFPAVRDDAERGRITRGGIKNAEESGHTACAPFRASERVRLPVVDKLHGRVVGMLNGDVDATGRTT